MVVKKKRTYKNQKGDFVVLSEILKNKIYPYFYFVKYLINRIYFFLQNTSPQISISQFKHDMELSIRQHNGKILIDNILIQKLYQKIIYILQKPPNNLNRIHFLEKIGKCVLSDVFFSAPSNISNLTFTDILKKIFINILFIDYLKVDDIRRQNINEPNKLFEEKIINLLNKLFHITSFDDTEYLISLLRKLFLEEYQRIYGIPVFYGNTFDRNYSYYKLFGYNQFICEKVGVSSKDKRNYIINPVGALAYEYIDKKNYLDTPLYDLLRKILRFDMTQHLFRFRLPKLEYLRQTTTKFCIAINQFNNEEVYQEPTNDVSKCSKLFGCSLKMTAEIRPDNIVSDEHILELLSILLEKELNNSFSVDIQPNLPQINQTQPQNNVSQINQTQSQSKNIFGFKKLRNDERILNTAYNNTLKFRIGQEIEMMEKEISRRNIKYTPKEIEKYKNKINSMKNYLKELSYQTYTFNQTKQKSSIQRPKRPNFKAFSNKYYGN